MTEVRAIPTTLNDSPRAKVGDGKSVRVKVSENMTIHSGDFYELDGFFGTAMQSEATGSGQNAEVILNIEQAEYETSQLDAEKDFGVGDLLYFGQEVFTPDPQTIVESETFDNRLIGRVTDEKDKNNVIWFLLAPQ